MTKIRINNKIEEWEKIEEDVEETEHTITYLCSYKKDDNIMRLYRNNFSRDPRWCEPDFVEIYNSEINDSERYYLINNKTDLIKLFSGYLDDPNLDDDEYDEYNNYISLYYENLKEDVEFAIITDDDLIIDLYN